MIMHFGQYSYMVTTLIFAGGAVLIEYALAFRTLWRFWRLIASVAALGTLMTAVGEPVALSWRVWVYSPERMSQIFVFGAALETYFYSILVSIAISSATLYWAAFEERGLPIAQSTFLKIKDKLNCPSWPS
jgi:hypothetical protein